DCEEHYPPVLYNQACITQGFHSGHRAVDIGSYGGKRVNLYAIWNGTVLSTCDGAGDYDQKVCGICGNFIDIRHNTVDIRYCHLTSGSIKVSKGAKVQRAQKIGVMGTSGNSTGVHLHIRVKEISSGAVRDIRTRLELNGWRNCCGSFCGVFEV
ncbi:unnamed protein product, partial [Rotaria sp. Silwood1]